MAEPVPAVLARLGRAQAGQTARRVARAVGVGRPSPQALASVSRPDTPVALAAAGLLAEAAPPVLAAHCRRTYAFAALLGARDGLDWDAELLWVASMLHDLGLTEHAPGEGPFEQRGADAAAAWVRSRGWSPDRAGIVDRAIRMHMDVGRATRERPEVALLHLGAAADVTGMRLEDLSPQTVAEVVDAHPRLAFKAFFAAKVREEARAHPRSATARLCRYGQLRHRIKRAPFPE